MLLFLFLMCVQFSLLAVGGANTIVPELHRVVVTELHWMSGQEFAELFALAQAAPGPNVLIVSLVGWKVAGVPGAIVSLIGVCLPSSLLSFWVARWWQQARGSRLTTAISKGLAPLTVGLIAAGVAMMAASHPPTLAGGLLLAICALLTWRTQLNPLWLLAAGAAAGLGGLV